MITVVLWKWGDLYSADHVNRLARALKRNLRVEHSIVCLTDNTKGLDFDAIYAAVELPDTSGKRYCRRLWIFSKEAEKLFSAHPTLLQIDIDTVITGDITPLVTGFIDNNYTFQVWKCKMSSRYRFGLNPTFMMLQAGTHSELWEDYQQNPERRLLLANRDGWPASDQAIISHHFTKIASLTMAEPTCPVWTGQDGIIALRDELLPTAQAPGNHIHTPLPPNTRLVSFHGRFDPKQFTMLDWVKEHWLAQV